MNKEEALREEVFENIREIKRLAAVAAASGFRDIAPRAAEIEAMAHYMLYDVDAGLES